MDNEQNDFVSVTERVLVLQDIVSLVEDPRCGAISTFIGMTRNHHDEKKVLSLEYEAYEPMARRELRNICGDIRRRWNVKKIAIAHRVGPCPIGENSVVIAISSAHRREAIAAVEFCIEALKASVPIWQV